MDKRKESEILRLLLVTQSSNAINFNSNLLKIVLMALYDYHSEKMTVSEIRSSIMEKYDLEFTEEEIIEAIKSDKSKDSIVQTSETYQVNEHAQVFNSKVIKYSLTQKQREKYERHEQSDAIGVIVNRFSNIYDMGSTTKDEMVSLIERFLYNTFNTNTNTLLSFFSNNNQSINETSKQYSEEEKRLLNEFLNWDDPNKDELVFMIASYCVEYCMLTVKKNYSSYQYIFNGKMFYLDSNVIFRLAGINNSERQAVMTSFVKKCQDAGITLKYTNHTYNEIKETVKRKVKNIQFFLNGNPMVSLRNIRDYYGNNTDFDFFALYDKWSKDNPDKYSDYRSFEISIMRSIDKVLLPFKKEDFIDKRAIDKEFEELAASLQNYKVQQNAKVAIEAINTDINNFLYIQSIRKHADSMTISNITEYLISTDGNLCEWNKTILPGAIPIVVRPSVWHSLLLKFKGRAADDYRAFSLFLNLRYKTDNLDFDHRKPEILSIVQKMDEPVSVKDSILDVISEGLTKEYKEITDINEIIKGATDSVINNEAEKKAKNLIKTKSFEANKEGIESTINTIAKSQTKEIIDRNRNILLWLNRLRIVLGVVFFFAICFCYKIIRENSIKLDQLFLGGISIELWLSIAGIVLPFIGWCIIPPIKKKIEETTSFDDVYKERLNVLQKQATKGNEKK